MMKVSLRPWLFFIFLSLTFMLLGYNWLEREGLILGLILALGTNAYIYFSIDQAVLSNFDATKIEGHDPWNLIPMAHSISQKAKIPAPEILIIKTDSPQSFAVGRSIMNGKIIITEGLLNKLSPHELEALLAFQIAALKNLNTLSYAIGYFLSSLMIFISSSLDSIMRFLIVEKKNPDDFFSNPFTRLISPLVGFVLKITVRPSLYLKADEMAALWMSDKKNWAQALWKMYGYSQTLPLTNVPLTTLHFFAVQPLRSQGYKSYFLTQPKIEIRLERLIGYYPL